MEPPKSISPIVKKAEKLLSGYQSFSISTKIPKEWLVDEEKEFDKKMLGASSIKNSLNERIWKKLSEKTGLTYSREGDIRIVFDFRKDMLEISLEKIPIFVFGRYKKLVPGISQSRWKCIDCNGKGCPQCKQKGKHYESVEEKIGDVMKKHFSAKDYTMHASGREDVDATCSAGRAFVMEIKEPEKRDADMKKIAKEIEKNKEVEVIDLSIVPRSFEQVVTESHFDKEYLAEVVFEEEITDSQIKKIESLAGIILDQRTPTRVAHRRSDLVRKRKIIELKIEKKTGNRKQVTARIRAEAGTYIKELIHGDNGRTKPSFASILGFGAKCTKLEVSRIDDDFLSTVG
jgi:tRNA pseudouridine synthase 10